MVLSFQMVSVYSAPGNCEDCKSLTHRARLALVGSCGKILLKVKKSWSFDFRDWPAHRCSFWRISKTIKVH